MKSILLSLLFVCCFQFVKAQHKLIDSLTTVFSNGFRYEDGLFKGPYLDTLINKIAKHNYVLIGEQHHTNEIPMFVQYLMKEIDFDNYIMEGSQSITNLLKLNFNQGMPAYSSFLKRFPDRLGFYTFSKEREIVESFFSQQKNVIELDQVFASSDAPLLDYLLQTTQDQEAKKIYQKLYTSAEKQWATFAKNPNLPPPFKAENLPLLCSNAFKAEIQALLSLDLPAEEKMIIADLIKSNEIYSTAYWGDGYKSHEMRISLMKRNLLNNIDKLQGKKNLFKFGANHVSKYKSLLQNTPDIGSLALNLADADNQKSLHIAIFEKSGFIAGLFGEDIETNGMSYLKPFTDLVTVKEQWLVFDLNSIKKALNKAKSNIADLELKNFLEGFDYLIIVPEVTAQPKH